MLLAHKLPGYKLHPFETYAELRDLGLSGITHPRDAFLREATALARAARALTKKSSSRLARTGFVTGLPGGPLGIAAGVTVDLEEYTRRTFHVAQQVGHVFGLIPDPYAERVPDDVHEYFESVQPDVLSAILIALGSDAASSRGTEISKNIAERQTRLVLKNKSRQKLTTELGLRAAKVIGLHLAEGRLGRMLFSMVPVMGGGVNALFCYMSMQRIGRNLITYFEHEHRKVRPDVLSFWQNGGGERDKPLSLPSQIQITRPAEPIDT